MTNTRQMLGQIFGLLLTCLVLVVIIRHNQGVPFDAMLDDPRILFENVFSGPTGR